MNGFIFGFQRFVWCPKWTPASKNSGTNFVLSALGEDPRGGNPRGGRVKMLQHSPMRNLKFSCLIGLIGESIGGRGYGLRMPILGTPGRKVQSGSKLTRMACPPSQNDVDQQQYWQSQAYGEMDPTCPCPQSFAARVIKAVAGDH